MSHCPSKQVLNLAAIAIFLVTCSHSSNTQVNAFTLNSNPKSTLNGNSFYSNLLFSERAQTIANERVISTHTLQMSSDSSSDKDTSIWNPHLRKIMGFLSVIGMSETAYLTFIKWSQSEPFFCSLKGSCTEVLNGPYASVGDIPLSTFGFVALSISLSLLVWFGGAATTNGQNKESWPILQSGISSAILTTFASLAFYASIGNVSPSAASAATDPNMPPGGYPAPTITTKSSSESLALAQQLNSLNAKMYGAFWCSHCYDQKQNLGKEAMSMIPYVECARDGKNSQTDLCKEKDVPGYPTWIINDKQYPGEQSTEELEEILKSVSVQK